MAYHIPIRIAKIKKKKTNYTKYCADLEQLELAHTADENVKC